MLIRSNRDLKAQRTRRDELLELIASQKVKLAAEGKRPEQIERRLQPLRLRLQELDELIELYIRLKQGDLSVLDGMELGVQLIALRIAAGITQRELARKLKVSAAQVARDEVNEYRTAGIERFQRVAQVLGHKAGLLPLQSADAPVVEPGAQAGRGTQGRARRSGRG